MKYSVRVGERLYLVDIESLSARPIVATVEGLHFEVNPEETSGAVIASPPAPQKRTLAERMPASGAVPSGAVLDVKVLRAPIPGVIVEVKARPGDVVATGDTLFVIEAMKMRNSIRASRQGEVAEVLVSTGQTVNHNQELLRFTE
jgi:biotin carboxyl carrier protein